jgi:hypothetical protein
MRSHDDFLTGQCKQTATVHGVAGDEYAHTAVSRHEHPVNALRHEHHPVFVSRERAAGSTQPGRVFPTDPRHHLVLELLA